jgi:hypothetical protein
MQRQDGVPKLNTLMALARHVGTHFNQSVLVGGSLDRSVGPGNPDQEGFAVTSSQTSRPADRRRDRSIDLGIRSQRYQRKRKLYSASETW